MKNIFKSYSLYRNDNGKLSNNYSCGTDLIAVATSALRLGLSVEASHDMISRSDPCLLYLGLQSLVWLHSTLYYSVT